jgi:hypothetical protein
MSEFLKDWQPIVKDVNERDLILDKEHSTNTIINCSEGDTLFIEQKNWCRDTQYVAITRHDLYDIIFNFMSGTELIKLAEKKLELEFKNLK